MSAYAHQDIPFEKLVEELRPERSLSYSPLFQVMFALQNFDAHPLTLADLAVARLELRRDTAKFDLNLALIKREGGLRLVAEYNTDLFNPATITRLLGHYQTLLEGIVANPELRLSDLPLLTEPERHQLLVEWNDTVTDYPPARCVHEMVEEQARIRPDALAAESGGRRSLTGSWTSGRSDWLRRLRIQGVRANSLVAIYLERSLEMLVALLAVWKAGGAYVPIDPEYPAERVRFMLEDTKRGRGADPEVSFWGLARLGCGDSAVWMRRRTALRKALAAAPSAPPMSPEQLAYVIYTSGSTGRPKGVPITHASLFNLICWHQQAYGVRPADRATQIAGPAFDASVWEIWPYLTAGASVHIPDDSHATGCRAAGALARRAANHAGVSADAARGSSVARELAPGCGVARAAHGRRPSSISGPRRSCPSAWSIITVPPRTPSSAPAPRWKPKAVERRTADRTSAAQHAGLCAGSSPATGADRCARANCSWAVRN